MAASDDDSDWDDDDDDFGTKKIQIRIKPAGQVNSNKITGSVDELRATVESWKSLANLNLTKPNSRRSYHQSTVQLNNMDKFLDTQSILDGLIEAATPAPAPAPIPIPIPNSNLPLISTNNNYNNNHNNHNLITQNFQAIPPLENLIIAPKPIEILPVAFAIQECLDVKMETQNFSNFIINENENNNNINFHNQSSNALTYLKGCIRMAVPPRILDMILNQSQDILMVSFKSDLLINRIWINNRFAQQNSNNKSSNNNHLMKNSNHIKNTNNNHNHLSSISMINNNTDQCEIYLAINIDSIRSHFQNRYKEHSSAKYFILPELLRYEIESQKLTTTMQATSCHSPILGHCHWKSDLNNVTKVRIDIEILQENMMKCSLKNDMIMDFKIILNLRGNMTTYQSKPETTIWDRKNSRLIWTFVNLSEFIDRTNMVNGSLSCVAQLESSIEVSDVAISFCIKGRTLSGANIVLDDPTNFKLSMVKSEVRTGNFKFNTIQRST